MSTTGRERLYAMLPTIYRQRDVELGEPLRALMAVLEAELEIIESDIEGLYDNWFIETCEPWVVPYIGQLLGVRDLDTMRRLGLDPRAMVARILSYRRRKGTVAALEQTIRDVIGWHTLVVESYCLLSMTLHVKHRRPGKGRIFDLKDAEALSKVGTPFESTPRTIEAGLISTGRGRYNIGNIALYIWRLRHHTVTCAPVRPGHEPGLYTVHPLGYHSPLFNRPQPRVDVKKAVAPVNVPGPVSRQMLTADLQEYRAGQAALSAEIRAVASRYYGPGKALELRGDGTAIPPLAIVCMDLSTWARPSAGLVAIDPVLGRIAVPETEAPERLDITCTTGFSGDMGGGPYARSETRQESESEPNASEWQLVVARDGEVSSLAAAFDAWTEAGRPPGVIRIADHGAYMADATLELLPGSHLTIEALDGMRPSLHIDDVWRVRSQSPDGAGLRLSGLFIEGTIEISGAGCLALEVDHCTLLPGALVDSSSGTSSAGHRDRPVLRVGSEVIGLDLVISRSITGGLYLPAERATLAIRDSIVDSGGRHAIAENPDGTAPGPASVLERTTILGPVFVRTAEHVSDVIFTHAVEVERRQVGCVRYSYVPSGSQTPRRYRCQPDQAIAVAGADETRERLRLAPRFTSTHYGQPGFAQLMRSTAEELRRGSEDGSELGAFHHLYQPQREAILDSVLTEHMRFGLDVGRFFVT